MIAPLTPVSHPSHDEIALQAYLLWEQEGRPWGQDQRFWFQAETDLAVRYETWNKASSVFAADPATNTESVERVAAVGGKKKAAPKPQAQGLPVAESPKKPRVKAGAKKALTEPRTVTSKSARAATKADRSSESDTTKSAKKRRTGLKK